MYRESASGLFELWDRTVFEGDYCQSTRIIHHLVGTYHSLNDLMTAAEKPVAWGYDVYACYPPAFCRVMRAKRERELARANAASLADQSIPF